MTLDVVLGRTFDKEAATLILGELIGRSICGPQVHMHTLNELVHVDPMAFPPKVLHALDNVSIKVLSALGLIKIDKCLERIFASQQQNCGQNRQLGLLEATEPGRVGTSKFGNFCCPRTPHGGVKMGKVNLLLLELSILK